MRKKVIIIVSILMLSGLAAGGYWYFQTKQPEDTLPESGVFVMEDTECKHSI